VIKEDIGGYREI